MKKTLLLTLLLLQYSILIGQSNSFPCKTDEMHQQLFTNHSSYNKGIINAHKRLTNDTKNFIQNGKTKSNAIYVIPVVFHIIHNYGSENISDAQIHDALKQVNTQFRKMNADTSEIVSAFKSIAADTEIEFRLAQLDPNGTCTSGITRTVSSLTSPGNHDVKSLIQWPPNKYLNIYVCKEAAGLAGHALLPAAADTIPQWDGIVMIHSSVGTIGTSDYYKRTVLTHEIGHFLNLQHIWGGNNVPNYYYLPVANSTNCDYDDEVLDTPNTIGWQTCNLNGTTCGSLDNVQNYMDYAYCGRMFTEGQKQRMHACLNSTVAGRNNLWTEENLIATGTDDITYYLCQAKFEANKRVACVNDEISFKDLSFHGVQNRTWNFFGGNASSTSSDSVVVSYSQPGNYHVQLTIERNGETRDTLIENYIHILPNVNLPNFYTETFELSSTNQYHIVNNDTPYLWELTDDVGKLSQKSIYFNNWESPKTIKADFYFNPVDISGVSGAVISFDYAYAQRLTSNNDLLKIYISKNCGQTWEQRKTLIGLSSLQTTTEPVTDFFIPNETEWKNTQATIGNNNLVEDLLVRFSFESNGGNNLYIDNIQVAHPDQLAINKINSNTLTVFPNPSNNSFSIQLKDEPIEEIFIYNIEGQVAQALKNINNNQVKISTIGYNKGIYLINIVSGTNSFHHIQIIE